MARLFCTVGHSDRGLDEFTELLRGHGVDLVVDVRKLRGSRHNPQFNEETLASALPNVSVGYFPAEALGGRRGATKEIPDEVNGFWRNRGFHNYADYALSDTFRTALTELRAWGDGQRTAVMCSEAVWWRCHRRIIADHLLAHEDEVRHILSRGRTDPATLTPGAVVHGDQSVTYPA